MHLSSPTLFSSVRPLSFALLVASKPFFLGQLGHLYLCTDNVQAGYAHFVLVVEEPHFPLCAIFYLPQDHQLTYK